MISVRPKTGFLFLLLFLFANLASANSSVPEPFRGFDDDSKYTIGYEDLSDAGIYSGSATPTLTLTGADRSYQGNRYRVMVNNTKDSV